MGRGNTKVTKTSSPNPDQLPQLSRRDLVRLENVEPDVEDQSPDSDGTQHADESVRRPQGAAVGEEDTEDPSEAEVAHVLP